MEFEGRARISLQLNMAPLIDVVLLLLIFFMLTSTYLVAEAIDLELPFSDTARPVEEQDIVVVLTRNNTITVNDRVVPRGELASYLRGLITDPEEQIITLKTEKDESVEDMIGVMDLIREAGGQKVLIATQSTLPPEDL
jgi:biopolymer transport protein ExbD